MSELVKAACTWTENYPFFMAAEDELLRETSTTVLPVYCLSYDEETGIHSLCTPE